MKYAIIVALAVAVTACSTPPKNPATAPTAVEQANKATQALVTELQTSGGSLQIKFDDQGNWLALVANGTADVYGNDIATASKAARIRANATIAEFLSTGVKSTRTIDAVAKSLADNKATADGTGDVDARSNNVARKLTERMAESAQAMIKGVMVVGSSTDGESVTVTVAVTSVSIRGAAAVRQSMIGAM